MLRRLSANRPAPELAVNAITIAETYSGVEEPDIEETDAILSIFPFREMDFAVSRLAGQYRNRYKKLGRPLAISDVLLTAHAVILDATLITANVRDFPMPELKILRYDR